MHADYIGAAWMWQNVVDDDLKRPRFEQTQTDADDRQEQSEDGLGKERPVVAKDASVDRHRNFRLQISNFGLN